MFGFSFTKEKLFIRHSMSTHTDYQTKIMFLKHYFTVFTKNHEIMFLQYQQIKHNFTILTN